MFLIILLVYLGVMLWVGIVGSAFIAKDCNIASWSTFKIIFMYQYAIYEWTKEDLNIVGIVLLEILATIICWLFNVIIFLIFCISCIFDAIDDLFYFLFTKR